MYIITVRWLIVIVFIVHSYSLFALSFVTTKSNKVNMRTGPGAHYPIKCIYIHKNLPLKIIEEFEGWKKVCDINEDCGWIKTGLLSNKRYVMINENTFGYVKQDISSKVIMRLDKFVIIELQKCCEEWCLLSAKKHKAWVKRKFIWGQ